MGFVSKTSRIAVFGLGYVGCVSAACLAKLGHRVTGVDVDEYKVRSVLDGRAPFYEPGLESLVREALATKALTATTDAGEALAESSIALICVGTPSQKNGNQDLQYLERVSRQIAGHVAGRREPLTVAVRSTVFPGTCEDIVIPALGDSPAVAAVSHPEFLREGQAVRDFMHPPLLVVGGSDPARVAQVAGLYRELPVEPCLVSLRTAEMIKYACNAFHALKVTFANEIGSLCEQRGLSGIEVMETLCRDETLNLSSAYLRPGFAFGGSCLPKDLRALAFRAMHLDLKLPLIESILTSNQEHLRRATERVMELPAKRIGFFGLAFKENTDDLRESPVVSLLEHLIGKGRSVRVFDPHIRLDNIYGSNQRFLLTAIPHIGNLLDAELEETLAWADQLVIAQKPALEHLERIRQSGLPVIDLLALEEFSETSGGASDPSRVPQAQTATQT
jgi:GDP-mannose 6-dehydrogenase